MGLGSLSCIQKWTEGDAVFCHLGHHMLSYFPASPGCSSACRHLAKPTEHSSGTVTPASFLMTPRRDLQGHLGK